MGQLNGVGKLPPETPEQAAASIISALHFLAREAEAAGLVAVEQLIRQAISKAGEFHE